MGSETSRPRIRRDRFVADAAPPGPRFREAVGQRAIGRVSRGDRQVVSLRDRVEHAGQDQLVVLAVRVHDRHDRRGGRHHAFDAGAGQPVPPDTLDAADIAVLPRQVARDRGRPVRTVVVDDDDFVRDFPERRGDAVDHDGEIRGLVVCRQDHSQARRNGHSVGKARSGRGSRRPSYMSGQAGGTP